MVHMFDFDPRQYAATFEAEDYVYIPQGLSEEFYEQLCKQVDEHLATERLEQFALGDKQQALYEFPDADYYREFVQTVAALAGVDAASLVISERHLKSYEPDGVRNPMPHKDRFATQFALGFTVHNPLGSKLVIYPDDDRGVNPFNSWAELRDSMPPERLPNEILQGARAVEVQDKPRDVMMFRGNEIWHARNNAGGTVMLYFKLNAFHCDPLGEDPLTDNFRQQTRRLASSPDGVSGDLIPVLGRRVDYIQRRYNHHWQEVVGVVLWGESHFTIDEQEVQLLQAIDGQHSLNEVLRQVAEPTQHVALAGKLRKLANQGIVDLLPPAAGTA